MFCEDRKEYRGKAKDVWYRGLRACPWAKELYVLGFEILGDMKRVDGKVLGTELGFEELRGTWRVMGEKGLRVHVDLEDMFEEIGEMEMKKGRDEREKRRLR